MMIFNPKILFLALMLFLFACTKASAQSSSTTTTNLFNYQSVTGTATTNNGNSIQVGGVYVPAKKLLIQNSGLSGGTTNSLTVNEQISFDGVNWTTVATYNPAVTNLGVDTFSPVLSSQTIFMRAQIITTTNFSVGVMAQ